MKKKEKKYIMVKAYLNNNLGDDLFVHILGKRYPSQEFYVFNQSRGRSFFPENIINKFNTSDKVLKILDGLLWRIGKCLGIKVNRSNTLIGKYMAFRENKITSTSKECVLITGSGFIESEERSKKYYLEREATFYKNNPILIGCNFGPYMTEEYLYKYKKMFSEAKDICFRDKYSQALFSDMHNTRCEMDVIFTYNLGEKKLFAEQDRKKYMLISVVNPYKDDEVKRLSDNTYNDFIKGCILEGLKRGLDIVMVGFCRKQKDDVIIEQIIHDIEDRKKIHVFNYPDISYQEAMGLFKYADTVIASRYHAMIIAMLYQKLVYPIAYNEKMVHVLHDIDANARIALAKNLGNISISDFFDDYGYMISSTMLEEVKNSADKQFLYLDKVIREMEA